MTDRVIVYAGSIPLETDVLRSNKFAMVGIAKLAAAMLGTSTIVNGLACVPTGPASLTVNVNPGEIYSLVSMDATAYSSVAADTTHQIMKSGILLDAVNLSCPAPGTVGQSINYLVQVIYQDSDTDLTALPYYNAANPTQAWSGPNNSGTPQATTRKGIITMSAKAGAAAATGSQTTPAPDAGYTGLWVVTVANGQTQILAGNIAQYAGAPILPSSLLASIQNGNLSYAVATGTANAHVAAFTPAITQRVDGMLLRYKAPAANTGALTLNDGLGAVAVVGAAHAALQGGETITNGDALVMWNSSIGGGSYILIECTGGALQIPPATASQHAVQLGQVSGVVGTARNLAAYLAAASASATFTADEIVVESTLGGLRYCLPSYSQTINLATTGAGGMDTGTAPVSGYVALYAIYKPSTNTISILATNAASLVGNVYGGANMPSGYTASALLMVWPTNGSSQLVQGLTQDREFSRIFNQVLSSTSTPASFTSLSISGVVPANAKSVSGTIQISSSATATSQLFVAGDANGLGRRYVVGSNPSTAFSAGAPFDARLQTSQTLYWSSTTNGGTLTSIIEISRYSI
jgi:hypothetical protein